MKRIIDGKTYNTETSTIVAKTGGLEIGGESLTMTLYQTQGGAFFVHHHETILRKRSLRAGEPECIENNSFEPLTRDEAKKWVMEGEVELISEVFDEPPEAAEDMPPAATIYLRVPPSLKIHIEEAAEAAKLSLNSWAIRCMEGCVASQKKP